MKIREKRCSIANKGQSLMEYVLILSFCVIVIVSSVKKLENNTLKNFYNRSVDTRTGYPGTFP